MLDLLFDDVWQQLVGWMKELVQHQWDCCTLGGCSTRLLLFRNTVIWTPLLSRVCVCVCFAANEKTPGSLNPVQDSQSSVTLLSTVPTLVPKVAHSRVPPITAGQHFQVRLMLLPGC